MTLNDLRKAADGIIELGNTGGKFFVRLKGAKFKGIDKLKNSIKNLKNRKLNMPAKPRVGDRNDPEKMRRYRREVEIAMKQHYESLGKAKGDIGLASDMIGFIWSANDNKEKAEKFYNENFAEMGENAEEIKKEIKTYDNYIEKIKEELKKMGLEVFTEIEVMMMQFKYQHSVNGIEIKTKKAEDILK